MVGLDNLNDYYGVSLKEWRLDQLRNSKHASSLDFHKLDLEHAKDLQGIFEEKDLFDAVFNLAARAVCDTAWKTSRSFLNQYDRHPEPARLHEKQWVRQDCPGLDFLPLRRPTDAFLRDPARE